MVEEAARACGFCPAATIESIRVASSRRRRRRHRHVRRGFASSVFRPGDRSLFASGEWRGKAGGYAIQGIAGTFLVKIVGSYSNIVGLPLYETMTLLGGEGFPIHFGWLNAV